MKVANCPSIVCTNNVVYGNHLYSFGEPELLGKRYAEDANVASPQNKPWELSL